MIKNSLTLVFLLCLIVTSCAQNTSNSDDETDGSDNEVTTFYFIRHAEKDRSDPGNSNPHLTEKGKSRAERWREELSNVEFDVVYSTNYNRTKQTARPLADHNNLELTIYDPSEMRNSSFAEKHYGKTILIVGHSNTTPMFANAILGETKYDEMDDRNNANLYIVTIRDGVASSEMRKVE